MDLKWINSDLVVYDGDIVILDDSVLQELSLRIDTMKNEHWLVPTYGCNLKLRIGELSTTATEMLVVDDIEDALDQDNRIDSSSVVLKFIPSDVLTCDIYYSDSSIRTGG